MKTLIELFDERPIENVLATEVFRPERTVYFCSKDTAQDKNLHKKLKEYFEHRGVKVELEFLESSPFNSGKLLNQLRAVVDKYGDCMLDITGGTDAALFACGRLCAEKQIPAFTYSRKSNKFFDIHDAAFADGLPCTLKHTVEDCFLMAGGALRMGRVDNEVLSGYLDRFDAFFDVYMFYRSSWAHIVKYIQAVSQTREGQNVFLKIDAPYTVRGDRNQKIDAPESCLNDLSAIGFIKDLEINGRVRFEFADSQIRTWLRDIGSVLELYVYKACLDAGLFNDVRTSAVVDWEGDFRQDNVTNEIDVMAMKGTLPVFISCKTCAIATEALNELAILRDRFGGHGAKAAIVTTQACRNVTRHRASELDIDVIDVNDLKAGKLIEQIKRIMK